MKWHYYRSHPDNPRIRHVVFFSDYRNLTVWLKSKLHWQNVYQIS